jgi:chromosome segregation ATPase
MRNYLLKEIRGCDEQLAALAARRSLIERELQKLDLEEVAINAQMEAFQRALSHAEMEESSPTKSDLVDGKNQQALATERWQTVLHMFRALGSGHVFSTDDIERELMGLGHQIKRNSLRSRLSELVQDGELERVGEGKYRFPLWDEVEAPNGSHLPFGISQGGAATSPNLD